MRAWSSTVPAAISGLVAAFSTWPDLTGVPVHDGPVVSESKALEGIVVGFTGERMSRTGAYPEQESPAADYVAAVDALTVTSQQERYSVRSVLAVLNGSKDIAAARQRAYDLLSFCGAAVAADKTLGGAVAMASMGTHQMTPEQAQRGALVTIVFSVDMQAWTGR